MHPYEMQRLVRERHKDEVLALKRGSLYHAVNRLHRAHLIAPVETARSGRRPAHTTYSITREGRRELTRWLRQLIALPERETPVFMASVSYLLHLSPDDAARQLETRTRALEEDIARYDEVLTTMGPRIGRLNLLEVEYAQALRVAELEWVRGLLADLRSGRLTWSTESLLAQVRAWRAQRDAQKELQT
jgi:DNA-binding PadR family transcriptional regulator